MKTKGSNAERELVSMFWENGFAALRIAGSGRMNFPCSDVLASDGTRIFSVECKSTKKNQQYITNAQIGDLFRFSEMFSAQPVVGVKFGNEWRFYNPEGLKRTPSGQVAINKKDKFKTFSDLISKVDELD